MSNLLSNFTNPPKGYGEVSFYWWLGDKLTKERILWQLDKLSNKHIEALQVNYAHSDEGGNAWGLTYKSDPPLFTEEWWELYKWFIEECKKRGMSVSLSDYTLCNPGQGFYTDEVLKKCPEVTGSLLNYQEQLINEGEKFIYGPSKNILSITAYKINNNAITERDSICLSEALQNENPWTAPSGQWKVVIVYSEDKPNSIDFMNPVAGREISKEFFQKFEERLPQECGKGLNYFFSDELSFNISGNMWNSIFANEFTKRKGYDIRPYLAAIFMDIGDITQKIRLDYYDVVVQLEEEGYFIPVYNWHAERGMTLGCDHGGRGKIVNEFGDYFRTQKWNQGPGNDQPFLESDIIKNKVSSSIAHMYQRPRVWLEGFYGSGWGTSSCDVSDATFRNFLMGHNLLTLHGLYYSTHGGWWEWAPPCNHFRMPYWEHMGHLLKCTERLSFLISQGTHVCDVAIVYPVAAVEGGIDGDISVKTAFSTGEYFYKNGLDFDFIDFESIERSEINNTELCISGESFKVIVIPSMKTIRYKMYKKLLDFHRAGGIVICIGSLPEASDNVGKNDDELYNINHEIFGSRSNCAEDPSEVFEIIAKSITMDFVYNKSNNANVFFLHRKVDTKDIYLVYGMPKGSVCKFRARGSVELWNPWTAEIKQLTQYTTDSHYTSLKLPLEKNELNIIVFDNTMISDAQPFDEYEVIEKISLNDNWGFELKPVLENKFGDFRLPAFDGCIGAEIRKLEYSSEATNWEKVSCGYGPKFLKLGPLKDSNELVQLESKLIECNILSTDMIYNYEGKNLSFKNYEYSDRIGIEGDPGHQGYHGLKGKISDEFLYMGKQKFTNRLTEYLAEEEGDIYYFWSSVTSETDTIADILESNFKPIQVWVNGTSLRSNKIPLRRGVNTILLKYKGTGRTYFVLEATDAPKNWRQEYPLSMNWYGKPGVFQYDIYPEKSTCTGKYRFTSAPGLKQFVITAYGSIIAYINGNKCTELTVRKLENCAFEYTYQIKDIDKGCSSVEFAITHQKGKYGGAALPEPIKMECAEGIVDIGDWSKSEGLHSYSGGAYYRKSVIIDNSQIKNRIILDLGNVVSSVELKVNGKHVGIRVAPSWKFDITEQVVEGENNIEALVYNTLSNHYISIPTKYLGKLESGILGPVSLLMCK